MKNYIILGLASLLLFSVAAGLSVWLQQSKTQAVADEKDKEAKKGLKDEKDKDKAHKEEKPAPKTDTIKPKDDQISLESEKNRANEAMKSRETRLEKLKAQHELILQDLRTQREELERLGKQVSAEGKQLLNRSNELEAQAQELADQRKKSPVVTDFAKPKEQQQPDPNEKKNIDRLAVMYESMPPESAAKILQEMCDRGNMDTAVKVLLQMRERQAGKVLAEIQDTTLAAQLIEKLRLIRRPPIAGSAAVGGTGS